MLFVNRKGIGPTHPLVPSKSVQTYVGLETF
jgi:hypothetical protein